MGRICDNMATFLQYYVYFIEIKFKIMLILKFLL